MSQIIHNFFKLQIFYTTHRRDVEHLNENHRDCEKRIITTCCWAHSSWKIKLMCIILRGRGLSILCRRKGKTLPPPFCTTYESLHFFHANVLFPQSQFCYTRKQTLPADVAIGKTFYILQRRDYIWHAVFFCRAVTYMMGFPAFSIFESFVESQVVMAMCAVSDCVQSARYTLIIKNHLQDRCESRKVRSYLSQDCVTH